MRDAFGWAGIVDYLVVTVMSTVGTLLVRRALQMPLKRPAAMCSANRAAE